MKNLIKIAAFMAIFANISIVAMNQTPVICAKGYQVYCSAAGCGCIVAGSTGATWQGGGVGPEIPSDWNSNEGVGPELPR